MSQTRLCLLSLLFGVTVAHAQIAVTLDTRGLPGNVSGPFSISFQLADGSLTGDGNNAVMIRNFQFGGGAPSASPSCFNSGSGDLSSSVTLTDRGIFETCVQSFVPGATLSFDVAYTANRENGTPDEFVVMLLDKNLAPIPTAGGDALLQIDFDSPKPTVQAFAGVGSVAMPAPIFRTINADQSPRAVFRNTSGSIEMSTYASAVLSNASGVFGSDPAGAEDLNGNFFTAARDTFNALWVNVFNDTSQTWAGWSYGAGVFQGVPAITVAPDGTAWITARDTYNSYWLNSYSTGGGWGTWLPLYGVFSVDPVITSCADGSVYVVGKDTYNSMWSGRYIPGTGFQNWQFGGGIIQGKPSITCGSDNAVYMVARDMYNSHWMARIAGNTWTGWFFGGALDNANPKIAALGGSVAVVILDPTNVVWRSSFTEGTGNGWQAWTQVGGVLQDYSPAAVNGDLYVAGRAPNNDLWWWRQNGNQWTWIGNNGVAAGALAAGPR